jgi:hypothetical protein
MTEIISAWLPNGSKIPAELDNRQKLCLVRLLFYS